MVYGARVSLLVGLFASLIVLVIGLLYGSISGYCGGKVDLIMMRIVDIIYSLPDTLMVILLSVVLNQVLGNALKGTILAQVGTNMLSLFVVFGLLYWVSMARLVRGQILSIKTTNMSWRPAPLAPSPAASSASIFYPTASASSSYPLHYRSRPAIFTESFLSFIGLGVQAPMPSLGSLANAGARRHAELSVEDALPGAEHLPDRAELQPAGRRPARRLRPQAEEVMNE